MAKFPQYAQLLWIDCTQATEIDDETACSSPKPYQNAFKDGQERRLLRLKDQTNDARVMVPVKSKRSRCSNIICTTDIPYNYVYGRSNWKGEREEVNSRENVVVNAKDAERFYLADGVLHVPDS
ncbi:hypothetical protein AVEN_219572-1 [Araneus ventricosus]|uniref:Uncharacterized protein n=1 Tax=Araneus ventricosus TaxID=182803 RepID=A0A4Y2UXN4_ARAVE|nr:hypothetical protein AVEN_219572-1 [Araneus ventricosus]